MTDEEHTAYLAILTQHAGKSVWDRVVRDAMSVLQTRTWSGTASVTLLQHTSMQRKAFIQLSEAGEHVPTELPNNQTRVSYLLDLLKTDNPKMLTGTAVIEQDELGKCVHFESTVTFLLQFDPVVAKNAKAKGLGVNVSGAAADKPVIGTTSVTLLQHTSTQRKAFIQLSEAGEHVPIELPNNRTRVSYLLDLLKTDNPKMLAGTAAIEQDELGKCVHFENTVTFLLQFYPVVAKNAKAKGLGVNVLGAAVDKPVIGATVGKTGVELRWHEPQKFSKLTKEQKLELSEWNKSHPKRDGGKKRTSNRAKSTDKWKKARVASMSKAHTELMEAMADSHSADMAVMNARIAGMATIPPAGVATGRVGAAVGFHPGLHGPPPSFIPESIDVMAERARVASVNLKNILKPPLKQAAP